ncbi:MAG: phytochelatin synthase family protein [Rhodospirillales bacterium]|nr:phytochelatin synthase family protein [Rhodospirillales bacterium]
MSNPEPGADLDSANGKYAPWVSLLREDSAYLRMAPAPAYWALAPYYVGQFTETACSLASVVMVVNAGRAHTARSAGSKLVTQPSLLDAVGSDLWRAGVERDDGRGVGLLQLQGLLAAGLRAHDLPAAEVAAVPLVQHTDEAMARFRAVLRACEAAPGQFVIANYYMAAVIGRGDYGHFSPIGAYDAAHDRVLILDVYRVELEPYWVPAPRLLEGMATISRADGEPRGYLTVRLPAS